MGTILQLFEIGGIHRGKFFQKAGGTTSIYVDLRPIVTYPKLLQEIAEEIFGVASQIPNDLICGVPYGAFALATAISITHNVPMVFRRKEAKNHGLARMVEGKYSEGQRVVVLEDVVSTGTSVLEAVRDLRASGLVVEDVVTWLNREQGGPENLAKEGVQLHAVYTLEELTEALKIHA